MLALAGGVLGLFQDSPAVLFEHLSGAERQVDPDEVERMIQDRTAARGAKDWARADTIRDRLKAMGVILEDGPQGTTWRLDV